MPHLIPENLIETFTRGPSPARVTQVSQMQNYIQELLGDTHHTFLQGSYKNDTAISDINDVDVVAVRRNTYSGTFAPSAGMLPVIYWDTIFLEIETKLRAQKRYSWTVTRGDKCITVRGAFNADVVPAVQAGNSIDTDPISVWSFRSQSEKVNAPRMHYNNGVEKNRTTDGTYKPSVRLFKNWVKNHFRNDKNIVSSFKMEALVHATENEHFNTDHAAGFILIGNNIAERLGTRNVLPVRLPSVCGLEDISMGWDISGRNAFRDRLNESVQLALAAYKAQTQTEAERYWKNAFKI